MNINTTELITVSTYARRAECSVQNIYKQMNASKLDLVEIDGVKFVRVKRERDLIEITETQVNRIMKGRTVDVHVEIAPPKDLHDSLTHVTEVEIEFSQNETINMWVETFIECTCEGSGPERPEYDIEHNILYSYLHQGDETITLDVNLLDIDICVHI